MKFLKFWFPLFLYSGIIFLLSAVPNLQALPTGGFDKICHAIEYALLGYLWGRALTHASPCKGQAVIFWGAVLLSFLYAISDEFHQSFTPGREPRIRDVAFDTIGASLAMLLIWKRF